MVICTECTNVLLTAGCSLLSVQKLQQTSVSIGAPSAILMCAAAPSTTVAAAGAAVVPSSVAACCASHDTLYRVAACRGNSERKNDGHQNIAAGAMLISYVQVKI